MFAQYNIRKSFPIQVIEQRSQKNSEGDMYQSFQEILNQAYENFGEVTHIIERGLAKIFAVFSRK
jgi:hypothetical protein